MILTVLLFKLGECAGKTYTLIVSIKYFLQHKINELRKNN